MIGSDRARSVLCLHLFGPFAALLNGAPLSRRRTRKGDWLLALLALRYGREVERAWLAGMLWPDRPTSEALALLRRELTDLRRALGPEGERLHSPTLRTLRLDLAEAEVDLLTFDQAVERGDPASLETAVRLYRGPLLEGCEEEWIFQERQVREQACLAALETLAAQALERGDPTAAEQHLRRAVAADPLRESAQRSLLQALAAGGNYSAVVQTYREFRERLHQELNTAPDPETQALFEQLRTEARGKAARGSQLRAHGSEPALPAPYTLSCEPPFPPAASIPEGENRLVTVLFADMSRYPETTRDLEPEDTADLVSRLLPVMAEAIVKYGGRVDRFQGDGVLAVFGVPQAREEDPERAVRAAIEIRAAAHDLGLEVRVGVNTGSVYAGAVGSGPHQEVTVIGPAVSLAARLQEQAQPGEILVGEPTYRPTRRAFAFTPRQMAVKGLSGPVVVYRVETVLARPEKSRGIEGLRAALIGREEELGKLRKALAAVRQGQGQMVALIGEAGVGKSRLVAELKQLARSPSRDREGAEPEDDRGGADLPSSSLSHSRGSELLWLEGRCLELGMSASYWLFVDLFRAYSAFDPEVEERQRADRLVAALRDLVADGHLSEECLEEIGPLLGNMLSLRFGTDWDQRLNHASPEQIKHQTFLAIRDLLLALAQRQPLILVCEDLHWADSLSLDVLSLLMESLLHAPLLLLCVYRPEREHKCRHLATIAARKCPERYTEIALRELTPQQSRRLVESLLTIEKLPTSVKELILEKARGNPFFVEEVIRSLIDAGLVYREGEVWRAGEGIETVTVPASIQSVILSRVDRLRPELKHVLQSASVLGRLFRRRLLESMTSSTTEGERALWELEDQALIYAERAVPEEEYSFQHVLTQETVYQSLLRRQRAAFHQKAAEAIESLYPERLEEYYEQLAYHYEPSGCHEKAVEYLLKTGEKARRAYLNEAAISYFRRALERLDNPQSAPGNPQSEMERRLAALTGLGRVYHDAGRVVEAEECFRAAVALGKSMQLAPRPLARLMFHWGEALQWQSRFAEELRLGEEGLALLGADTECLEAALMNSQITAGSHYLGHWKQAPEYAHRNMAFVEGLPYTEELAIAYFHIIMVCGVYDRNVPEALRWAARLRQQGEQHHDRRAVGTAHLTSAYVTALPGDVARAIEEARRALEVFTSIGDSRYAQFSLQMLALYYYFVGQLPQAEECKRRAMEIVRRVGHTHHVATGLTDWGQIRWSRGDRSGAVDDFREALQLFQEIDDAGKDMETVARLSLGTVALAEGEREEARRQFLTLLERGPGPDIPFTQVLSALEATEEDPAAFGAFCRRFRETHPEAGPPTLTQWHLEPLPALPDFGFWILDFGFGSDPSAIQNPKSKIQNETWTWHDPFSDCAYTVAEGLVLRAANVRSLDEYNQSAPRLLRPAPRGEFVVQTVCSAAAPDVPAQGGLLLWAGEASFVRLDWGSGGPGEVTFTGLQAGAVTPFGRGMLRGASAGDRVFLRLERTGARVRAFCSLDGGTWYTVGAGEFPSGIPLQVGIYALGQIDRLLYPGAFSDGTAIRFEQFDLWRKCVRQ